MVVLTSRWYRGWEPKVHHTHRCLKPFIAVVFSKIFFFLYFLTLSDNVSILFLSNQNSGSCARSRSTILNTSQTSIAPSVDLAFCAIQSHRQIAPCQKTPRYPIRFHKPTRPTSQCICARNWSAGAYLAAVSRLRPDWLRCIVPHVHLLITSSRVLKFLPFSLAFLR